MPFSYPSTEYTIAGYIQGKTGLAAKIQAMEVLEGLMMNSILNYLGGDLLGTSAAPIVITIGVANIFLNGTAWQADLTNLGIVPNPASLAVTVDLTNSGTFVPLSATFNPATFILSPLSNPLTFPNQVIKIAFTIAPASNMAGTVSYELDDGQVRIKTAFRSVTELEKGLDALRKTKNIYINQFNGRTFVLQDKRTFR
jgi:hypothetical protein